MPEDKRGRFHCDGCGRYVDVTFSQTHTNSKGQFIPDAQVCLACYKRASEQAGR